MSRFAQVACAATAIMALAAVTVRADPINITGGSVIINGGADSGSTNLVGTNGFTLTSLVAPDAGIQGPFDQCFVPECPPGTRIRFDLGLSGSSGLLGNAVMTIGGDRYDDLESVDARANVLLTFTGSVVAPDAGPARVTVSAPFSMTGRAFATTPLGQTAHDDPIFGRGTGTLTLVPFPPEAGFGPLWIAESLRFDFAQPTPEPSTLLLLGTCAVGLVRAQRSRLSKATES